MVENNNVISDDNSRKVKVCLMRHGQTTYIEEYQQRKAARDAAGWVYEQMTDEEVRQWEAEFHEHEL